MHIIFQLGLVISIFQFLVVVESRPQQHCQQCPPHYVNRIEHVSVDPCNPMPCGLNTKCRAQNGQAVCRLLNILTYF